MIKSKINLHVVFVIAIILLISGFPYAAVAEEQDIVYQEEQEVVGGTIESVRALVMEVMPEKTSNVEYSGGSIELIVQVMKVKIEQGPYKGKIVNAEYNFNSFNPAYNIVIKKGDRVFLYIEGDEDGSIKSAIVTELVRDGYLLYLALAFIILLVVVGRGKGVKAVITLGLTCLAVFKIFMPLILKGFDPVKLSVGICIAIISITLVIISGFSKKTLTAVVGTAGGLMVAGIIALVVGAVSRLTGLGNEESHMLMYIPQNINFNFQGLLFAGIIIGALGAVMDVGMSIASAMHEVERATPKIKTVDLIKAGMNVGRDIMATMSNTLILAYAGGSLHIILLFMAYDVPLTDIINTDLIASEVVRALAGSIGLIFTIPLTALAAGVIRGMGKKPKKDYRIDYRY